MVLLPRDSDAHGSSLCGHTEPVQEGQKLPGEERFRQLYVEVWNDFRYRLLRILRTFSRVEDAENLVSEGYARLWKSRMTLPADITVRRMESWLVTVCTRLAIDQSRGQQRHRCVSLDVPQRDDEGDTQEWEIAGEDGDFAELIDSQDFCRSILGRLAPDDAAILTLRFLAGLAPREIAPLLGIKPGDVSVRITRAKKQARMLIEARGREK